MAIRRLTRPLADAKVAGVCAGLADYLNVDVTLVRAAWVVLSIVPGAVVGGLLAYLAAWLIIPEGAAAPATADRRLTRSSTDKRIAGVCGGIAECYGVDSTPVRLLWVVLSILFGAVVGGVAAYLLAWLIIPAPSASSLTTATPATPAAWGWCRLGR